MSPALKELLFSTNQLRDPRQLPSLAAWYDASDLSSFVVDSANRVSLWADKSGNSNVNCLCLNGVAGNYASAPDSVALSITGDIDIRIKMASSIWAVATAQTLAAKRGGAGQWSWQLDWSNNAATFYTSADGTAQSNLASASFGFSNFEIWWVRVTRVAATGAITFYKSADGVTWTQVSTGNNTSGNIFDSTTAVTIGSLPGNVVIGNIYRAQIYNGIAGTLAFDANFTVAAKLATSFTESSSNAATVTINTSGDTGARISGVRDLYQGTVNKQPRYLGWLGINYAYFNGVAANYLGIPSNSALADTGDKEIRVNLAQFDTGWIPSATQTICGKFQATNGWVLQINGAGKLLLFDGTSNILSTVAIGGTAWSRLWIRVTHQVNNGAGGRTTNFYKSTDYDPNNLGSGTWTQIGTTVVTATATNLAQNGEFSVGAYTAGTLSPLTATVYRLQMWNGFQGAGGTLSLDLDPSRYASTTTFIEGSANAATVTINAGAIIVTRTIVYHGGSSIAQWAEAAGFSLTQPETVYLVAAQVSWASNSDIFDGGKPGINMVLQQTAGGSSPNVFMFAGANGPSTNNFAIKTHAVIMALFNAATSFLRVNRLAASSGSVGALNANGFTLGAQDTGGVATNVAVSEVAIYATAHNMQAQDRFAIYAGKKWRIAV